MRRIVCLLALVVAGCGGRGFRVRGELASEGGVLETWRVRPQGCMRSAERDSGGFSLLWVDPTGRDAKRQNKTPSTLEDAPVRLDLSGVGAEPVAVLETLRTQGTEFNKRNCERLELETHEGAPTVREGRSTLGGHLSMDCAVRGQHVTAEIDFAGCDY